MSPFGCHIVRGFIKQDCEGNPIGFRRAKDGLPYGRPRKKYMRKHLYPTVQVSQDGHVSPIRHFKAEPRLKTAFIKLREKGRYSITALASVSGRSTSFVWKAIHSAENLKIIRRFDNRKCSRRGLLYTSRRKLKSCFDWFQAWLPFILGEEGDPP